MSRRDTRPSQDGERASVGIVEVTHHFRDVEAEGLPVRWHFVTAGDPDAEVLLLVHGNPESWRAWEPQIEHFADRYRVLAVDLKGYGQGDKRPGDWRWSHCAVELRSLLDALEIPRVSIVAHDRGCVLSDHFAGRFPDRVVRYVRMQQLVHIFRPENSPQAAYFADPVFGPYIFGDPDYYFHYRLAKMLKNPVTPERLETLAYEMSYPGLADAVIRYYQSSSFERERLDRMMLMPRMEFPVLLLNGDRDDGQPPYYYDHPELPATACFPDAELEWILGAGHYTNLENPKAVTDAVERFFSRTSGRAPA
jgi:pimeloyl-ACP methyl ester carboxylesterase